MPRQCANCQLIAAVRRQPTRFTWTCCGPPFAVMNRHAIPVSQHHGGSGIVGDQSNTRPTNRSIPAATRNAIKARQGKFMRPWPRHSLRQGIPQLNGIHCSVIRASLLHGCHYALALRGLRSRSDVRWRLDGIMASLAQRLQIRGRVRAAIIQRHDVINDRRRNGSTSRQADSA